MKADPKKIIEENRKRLAIFWEEYDPVTGVGSKLKRKSLVYWERGAEVSIQLPVGMFKENAVKALVEKGSVEEVVKSYNNGVYSPELHDDFEKGFIELRFQYDFEFWAFVTVVILDKKTSAEIPFRLNRSQRKYLARLERLRLSGKPIRVILLKARQWGGSTLTQVYMAWIQIIHKRNWSSAVIADVDDQAKNIRGMYERILDNYPDVLGGVQWKPYQGSTKNKEIVGRGGIIGVGSVQSPENLRSYAFQMVHMSEVGLWKSTPQRSAESLAQASRAGILNEPYTLIVMESTAKGVGNFFHKEWQRAIQSEAGYDPVFVGTWEIELYQREIKDYEKFIQGMGEYDWFMWELGATLEAINWYRTFKEDEGFDDWKMKSEYPNTAEEAFQSTGRRVFAPGYVLRARKNVREPMLKGELFGRAVNGKDSLGGIEFQQVPGGNLEVWSMPDYTVRVKNRYCAFADIGGRTDDADYSVVKVFDRYWMMDGGVPEVVAMWRGHLDQDLFAWKAAQLSKWYDALLAVETNSLRTDTGDDGDHFLTILDEIVDFYPNLYCRTDPEKIKQGAPIRYGFHTNPKSKEMIINSLNKALRQGGYIERSRNGCDEMDYYELKTNGKYGAVDGEHDDEVMVTAGGVWLCYEMDMPVVVNDVVRKPGRKIVGESTL